MVLDRLESSMGQGHASQATYRSIHLHGRQPVAIGHRHSRWQWRTYRAAVVLHAGISWTGKHIVHMTENMAEQMTVDNSDQIQMSVLTSTEDYDLKC